MEQNTIPITLEIAVPDDYTALAVMNRALIDEGGQNNKMTVAELENRMRDWFQKSVYTGYSFKLNGKIIGYTLVNPSEIRHFYILPEHRRRGYGRVAISLLFEQIGLDEIGLSCLTNNAPGQAFWRSFNHEIYSMKFFIRNPNNPA